MTPLEYMQRQFRQHCNNYERESARNVPQKMLTDIANKASYYAAAVEALQAREEMYPHEANV